MDSTEELKLVTKARAGDKGALAILYDDITPKLFGYLINATRNKTLAEDLLQSTWLKAIGALPNFKPQGVAISAWLFAIARNECRQQWRKSNREVGFDPVIHEQEDKKTGEFQNEILIDQLLNSLSEDDQELLRLRYIAGLNLTEIAKVLNINSIAARVRMHRALARARAAANS